MSLRHPSLSPTLVLAIPVLAASVLQQINSFTDKLFASSLEAGRNAALSFANALGSAPRTVLLFPLLMPLFPLIAGYVAKGKRNETAAAFHRAAGILALVAIPVTVFMAIGASEIAQVAFGRGKCGAGCVSEIASPLAFYGVAVWGNFIGYLLNRAEIVGRSTAVTTIVNDANMLVETRMRTAWVSLAIFFAVRIRLSATSWRRASSAT